MNPDFSDDPETTVSKAPDWLMHKKETIFAQLKGGGLFGTELRRKSDPHISCMYMRGKLSGTKTRLPSTLLF
jgi:hypothetical protein